MCNNVHQGREISPEGLITLDSGYLTVGPNKNLSDDWKIDVTVDVVVQSILW